MLNKKISQLKWAGNQVQLVRADWSVLHVTVAKSQVSSSSSYLAESR